jgi:outer membrane protein OmpA-like peptidoglycan-associated protein
MNARAIGGNNVRNLLKATLLAAGMVSAGAGNWALAAQRADNQEGATEVITETASAGVAKLPFTLAADVLFAFNSATLKSEAKPMLVEIASQLHGTDYGIALIGHTDRIGSDKYNENLSYRRAMAVRNYLVGAGVAPERIAVVEDGNAEPLPITVQCDDLQSKALKACLQPDRRVEIQGTAWVPELVIVDTVTDVVMPDNDKAAE